ncbi:ABC transporter permease [Oceanirhabdus seepicola]|uniref:ABC transporter permease n=2 Tax=Oceanirhabdus seepicola TaxID=2828781 RepID=A0A9J6P2H9_9CLOT|nr:ABC transporter permease [Oceanirhabdus seepicola]
MILYRARFIMSFKMYTRYPVNFIMSFIQPLIWLAPFYFMGKAFSSGGDLVGFQKFTGTSDYIGFLVVGFMVSGYVSAVFWSMGFSIKEEMRQGVLVSNWTAPVSRISLLISKSLYYFFTTTIEVITTMIICHFAFGFTINGNILSAIIFFIPGMIAMIGLGLIVGSLVLLAKNANPIIDMTNFLIGGLSGSYFPIKVLGRGVMFISLGIPLTYVYDGMRALLLKQKSLYPLRIEIMILLISAILFWCIGILVFNKVEKSARNKGLLSEH